MNTLAFVMLVFPVAAPGAKDSKDAPVGIVGKWKLESTTLNGNPLPGGDLTIIYTADGKYEERRGEKIEKGTFTIDPKKSPAELDSKAESSGAEPAALSAAFPAIYRIEGDTLTVCVSANSVRPTTFKPAANSGLIVSVFKRQKE